MTLAHWQGVHLHTVNDSVQYIGHERDIKEQVRKHRLLLEYILEFKSLESSDSEQHNGEVRETRRGRAGQARQDKRHAPEEEVGRYHSSSIAPVFQPKFSISSCCVENPSHCSWTSSINPSRCSECGSAAAASTHHEVLECGSAAVFQMHHFVDACGAELRSCCVFRNRRLIF